MISYFSHSAEDTERIGRILGDALRASNVRNAFIALRGEMGVGKTAFTRGFAAAFSVNAVRSPTYTVVNEYKGDPIPLFHFDLYRLEDEDDLYSIGFDDYLSRRGLILCEWTEKVPGIVPHDAITVSIRRTDANEFERVIDVTLPSSLDDLLKKEA